MSGESRMAVNTELDRKSKKAIAAFFMYYPGVPGETDKIHEKP
jgi:hypothetical protein